MDTEAKILKCEQLLGYTFRNKSLLQEALTLRGGKSDEFSLAQSLEFVGDALYNAVIAIALQQRFSSSREGSLSIRRKNLEQDKTIFAVMEAVGLNDCAIFGSNWVYETREIRPRLSACMFESLVGAIYQDCKSFDSVYSVVVRLFEKDIEESDDTVDPKTYLFEKAWKIHNTKPTFKKVREVQVNPDDHGLFEYTYMCCVNRMTTYGTGETIKDAEQKAAANMLVKNFQEDKYKKYL